ncbi:hypothetical protein DPMN_049000 [Dreissena polymorpha]|uniref:Uncharacterized protein n=1 Tax=Dreissena polymorpha TaxID=45954 RepID=A0A9D4DEE9_DREPO|nr:hypothetical protein DPMN_049000 [Dreissena polymorpha]
MSKFHEDWEKKCVFTCCHYIHIKKTAQLPGGHVFSLIMTIFKLVRDIHISNAKHVTSRVGHVFLQIQTIIELNLQSPSLTQMNRSQDDRKINVASRVLTRKNAPPPGGHVFQSTGIIYKLVQDIIGINLLTKFHEDWSINN